MVHIFIYIYIHIYLHIIHVYNSHHTSTLQYWCQCLLVFLVDIQLHHTLATPILTFPTNTCI